jgi:hypothetical protein
MMNQREHYHQKGGGQFLFREKIFDRIFDRLLIIEIAPRPTCRKARAGLFF